MISAVILTKNENRNIVRCLKSLGWCDEIIIIDDFSTDGTVEEIKKVQELSGIIKIYQRCLDNDFSAQHNFGLSKAKGEWVLFIDADEIVSKEVADEIQGAISEAGKARLKNKKANANGINGYRLNRRDIFWGKELKYGEPGRIKLLRLAKKRHGVWKRPVHEFWEINGEKTDLKNPLYHYPHQTMREFISSINFYTDIDAVELPHEGKSFSFESVLFNPPAKFLQNYLLRLGFLDGRPGFVVAFLMSLHSSIVRIKMFERL